MWKLFSSFRCSPSDFFMFFLFVTFNDISNLTGWLIILQISFRNQIIFSFFLFVDAFISEIFFLPFSFNKFCIFFLILMQIEISSNLIKFLFSPFNKFSKLPELEKIKVIKKFTRNFHSLDFIISWANFSSKDWTRKKNPRQEGSTILAKKAIQHF